MSNTTPDEGNPNPDSRAAAVPVEEYAGRADVAQPAVHDEGSGVAGDANRGATPSDGPDNGTRAGSDQQDHVLSQGEPGRGDTVRDQGDDQRLPDAGHPTAAAATHDDESARAVPAADLHRTDASTTDDGITRVLPASGSTSGDTGAVAGAQPREDPAYAPAPTASQTPIYVQAPTPPRIKGNRGAGILIALLATVVYAALFALVVLVIAAVNSTSAAGASQTFSEFIARPVFYVPVIFFFLAFILLIALVNRGGWWAYVLFGFLVATVVYFSYIGGALLTVQAWTLTPAEAARFVSAVWLNPAAIAAAVIAREVPIWAGAWIARRGRKVTERNAEARREYDRQIAEGPRITRTV